MSSERSRDFGGSQGRGTDRGGSSGRDAGEEALLELARLIGSNSGDPFEPEHTPDERSEPRLGDVSRVVAAQASRDRRDPSFDDHQAGERDGYDHDDHRRGRGRDYAAHDDDGPGHLDDYDDEFDEPDDSGGGGGGRRRMRTIAVVLALVVLGGAGAWGYRTMVAAPSQPPVIHADNSPTKIAQMSDVKPDSRTGRVGEQVVGREEAPVDVGGGGTSSDDASSEPAVPGEPRHVHTVPIRADQGQSGDRSRSAAVPPPAAPPAPAVPPPSRQIVDAPPPPHAPVRRQAAVAPPPTDAAPADAAPPADGSYVVQLTAVKTEADAQSEFHRLQTKYASVLGGRQPLIRRKDKGDQVFYAAGIGGFGAKGDADQFCEQFKAAGGKSCYVYKN